MPKGFKKPLGIKLIWIQLYKLGPWLPLQQDFTDIKHQPHRETQNHTYFSKDERALGSGAPEIERMVKSSLHTSRARRDLILSTLEWKQKQKTYSLMFSL